MNLHVTYRLVETTNDYDGELPSFIDRAFAVYAANEALQYHACSAQGCVSAFPRGIVYLVNDLYDTEEHGELLSEMECDYDRDREIAMYSDSDWQSFPIAEIQVFQDFPQDYEDLSDNNIDNADYYQPYGWNLREILGLDGPPKYETPEPPCAIREDHHSAPEPLEAPPEKAVKCSFCGRLADKNKTTSGPSVRICHDCIDMINEMRKS